MNKKIAVVAGTAAIAVVTTLGILGTNNVVHPDSLTSSVYKFPASSVKTGPYQVINGLAATEEPNTAKIKKSKPKTTNKATATSKKKTHHKSIKKKSAKGKTKAGKKTVRKTFTKTGANNISTDSQVSSNTSSSEPPVSSTPTASSGPDNSAEIAQLWDDLRSFTQMPELGKDINKIGTYLKNQAQNNFNAAYKLERIDISKGTDPNSDPSYINAVNNEKFYSDLWNKAERLKTLLAQ